jgi:CDP-diglyceride synthetase
MLIQLIGATSVKNKSMQKILLTIAVSLTIGSATTSYHLSSLPAPTDAQKNLITAFNAIFAAGTTAVFGLLNDKDE